MPTKKRRTMRRKKETSRNVVIKYIIVLVLLVIFLATIGLELLFGATRFIAGFSGSDDSSSASQSIREDLVLEPELYDIPVATNSSQLRVTGTVFSDGKAYLYVNDNEAETFNFTKKENYIDTIVDLQEGPNTIQLSVRSDDTSLNSDISSVDYISSGPELNIDTPKDGEEIEEDEVTISGSTDRNVKVKVNGRPAVVGAEGQFSYTVRLKDGTNKITVTATDAAGNTEEQELKVKYDK